MYLMMSPSSPVHSLVFGSRNEYGQSFDVPTTRPFFWIFASESSSELILISEKSGNPVLSTGGGATAAACACRSRREQRRGAADRTGPHQAPPAEPDLPLSVMCSRPLL